VKEPDWRWHDIKDCYYRKNVQGRENKIRNVPGGEKIEYGIGKQYSLTLLNGGKKSRGNRSQHDQIQYRKSQNECELFIAYDV